MNDLEEHSRDNDLEDDDPLVVAQKRRAEFDKRAALEENRLHKKQKSIPEKRPIEASGTDLTFQETVLKHFEALNDRIRHLESKLDAEQKKHRTDLQKISNQFAAFLKKSGRVHDTIVELTVEKLFSKNDDLLWMGEDMAEFFNGLLSQYNNDFREFLANIAIRMWGDRINYYFFIPAGHRKKSGSQRRDLLSAKDPTGVACLLKVVNLILLAKKRAQLERQSLNVSNLSQSTSINDDVERRLKDYEEDQLPNDRKCILTQIGQKGLDLKHRSTFEKKARYYTHLEEGKRPTPHWTIMNEVFDDSDYRSISPTTKESSVIITIAQELYSAAGQQEKDAIIDKYESENPNLTLLP